MDSSGIPGDFPAISIVEVMTMMAVAAMLFMSALFLGPLLWRIRADRRQREADVIGADIRAAISRRLRGESFVAVRVTARSVWRAGRVVLSVPSGYESLVEAVWPGVLRRLPAGYEFVLAPTGRGAGRWPRDYEDRDLPWAA
jgi:hypothetical protein